MKFSTSVIAAAILAIAPARAAVIVTTGTTGDGKAYVTVPTITFSINRTVAASGFNALTFDFLNTWSATGPSLIAAGSGLTFTDSAHPGVFSVSGWYGQAASWNAFSDRDSILVAPPNTAYSYTIGDVITLQGGTFTLASATPSFPIFPSGSYEVYFVGLGANGGPLSAAGVAVPEPSTFVLVGLAGLGAIALRRRNTFSAMRKLLVIVGMALGASVTSQAQEITVKPVGISVSTLRRNLTGVVINPLKSVPEQFFLNGATLSPGTQVSMLVTLPEEAFALVGSNGPVTTGLKLRSLTDSTGKDLLTPPEGAIAENGFFAGNRDALAMSEDQHTLFLVALGIRAPRKDATFVTGEFLMDVVRGKILTSTQPFSQGGKIVFENATILSWGKSTTPRPSTPPGQGFSSAPAGPQKSTNFSDIIRGVIKIEILDSKDNVVSTIKGPGATTSYGMSWSDTGNGPYRILVTFIDPKAPTEQVSVPFRVSLGVSSE